MIIASVQKGTPSRQIMHIIDGYVIGLSSLDAFLITLTASKYPKLLNLIPWPYTGHVHSLENQIDKRRNIPNRHFYD